MSALHNAPEPIVSDTAENWIDNPEPVSRATALSWIAEHGVVQREFFEDLGDHEEYDSAAVFLWLGY